MDDDNKIVDIFVLQCVAGKYFVGYSKSLNLRISEHFSGNGGEWTSKYKPVAVIKVLRQKRKAEVLREFLIFAGIFGVDNVRGGCYSSEEISHYKKGVVIRDSAKYKKSCSNCGMDNHPRECCLTPVEPIPTMEDILAAGTRRPSRVSQNRPVLAAAPQPQPRVFEVPPVVQLPSAAVPWPQPRVFEVPPVIQLPPAVAPRGDHMEIDDREAALKIVESMMMNPAQLTRENAATIYGLISRTEGIAATTKYHCSYCGKDKHTEDYCWKKREDSRNAIPPEELPVAAPAPGPVVQRLPTPPKLAEGSSEPKVQKMDITPVVVASQNSAIPDQTGKNGETSPPVRTATVHNPPPATAESGIMGSLPGWFRKKIGY